MRSANYYRTRKVVRLAFWGLVLIGFYLIATRIWWVGGWCIGTIDTCNP